MKIVLINLKDRDSTIEITLEHFISEIHAIVKSLDTTKTVKKSYYLNKKNYSTTIYSFYITRSSN